MDIFHWALQYSAKVYFRGGGVKKQRANSEWGHERGSQTEGEQARDKKGKRSKGGKGGKSCTWGTLLRGAHITKLKVERHLSTGDHITGSVVEAGCFPGGN